MKHQHFSLFVLLFWTILCAPIQAKVLKTVKLNFSTNAEDYTLTAYETPQKLTDDASEDILGPTIVLKKGKKEVARLIAPGHPRFSAAEGFMDIVAKGKYFTIESVQDGGWFFVNTYITFKYDDLTKQVLLYRYGESYTDRREPEKDIPDYIVKIKERIPFSQNAIEYIENMPRD